jgi:N-acetylglucosamine repressor
MCPENPRHVPSPTVSKQVRSAAVPNLLRRVNERRIIEALQANGGLSRIALVQQTGISPPTVSKLVRSLLRARLLEEGEALGSTPGRPAKVLRLASERVCVIAAVIDSKECSVGVAGLDGQLQPGGTAVFSTPKTYPQFLRVLTTHVRRLVPHWDKTAKLAMGLSIPGLIDECRQQILLSANVHLLDHRFPARDLQNRLGTPVILLHDTRALCIGERTFGQARGLDDVVLIDATAGIGSAVMIDGQLLTGHRGMAGEIGHLTVEPDGLRCGCGNVGCLETVASDTALAAAVSQKYGRKLTIAQVAKLSRLGKIDATPEIQRTVDFLAIGVAAAVNLFNPAAVVVHAGMFDIHDNVFRMLADAVARRALSPVLADCKIVRSASGKLPSAIAATIHHLTTTLGPRV